MTYAKLPYTCHPLTGQPSQLRERVRIYETHATIDERDWNSLLRYDHSWPSGTYTGKVWRRGPWLAWYGRVRSDNTIAIGRARALVQGPGTNLTYRGKP